MIIAAIIQARLSSRRLPRKVLNELPFGSGITVLEQIIQRLKKSNKINKIIVATTEKDNEIVKIAKKEKVKWFQGSEKDVLERYYLAAKKNNVDVIVRITSDCPCIDSAVVDFVLGEHLKNRVEFTSNGLVRTFPHGIDVEIINFSALEKAHFDAKKDFEREHVTSYFYKTGLNQFKTLLVKAPKELYAPNIRITLDTKEDYILLCAVFDYLYIPNEFFTTKDIINLFKNKKWLNLINQKTMQKKICETTKEEIVESIRILDLQGLNKAKDILVNYFEKKI